MRIYNVTTILPHATFLYSVSLLRINFFSFCLYISVITGVVATLGCHAAFAFGSGSTYLPYLAMVQSSN